MALRTLQDISIEGARVLMRVDFNVPLSNGVVTDDTRIRAALPTIREILGRRPRCLILLTHVGRPRGRRVAGLVVKPIAARLSQLLGVEVPAANQCVGPSVQALIDATPEGGTIMLENVRFHEQETKNDPQFAKQLAAYGDVFVNDAFGTVHRAHASTVGIARLLPNAAGLLIKKEIAYLSPVLNTPQRPLVAIIGGAKISSKISVLSSLIKRVDKLIIGGGMAYTFLCAQRHRIGTSLVETDQVEVAATLLENARNSTHLHILLPLDHRVIPHDAEGEVETETTIGVDIPDRRKAVDIGPKTIRAIGAELTGSKTVFWNGPMGIFEIDGYAQGTMKVAQLLARCPATTIVGGGDSVAALNKFGLASKIDHISTGGGASMEYIEGKTLPGLAVLKR